MRNVHIKSPGIGYGTTVTDADTGVEFQSITEIGITIEADKINRATVHLAAFDLDAKAAARFVLPHPINGELKTVRKIEFDDGEVLEL